MLDFHHKKAALTLIYFIFVVVCSSLVFGGISGQSERIFQLVLILNANKLVTFAVMITIIVICWYLIIYCDQYSEALCVLLKNGFYNLRNHFIFLLLSMAALYGLQVLGYGLAHPLSFLESSCYVLMIVCNFIQYWYFIKVIYSSLLIICFLVKAIIRRITVVK